MRLRLTSLVVLAAFALAPLAQAVDCLMHEPVRMHGHEHHTADHGMTVAECMDAAMDAVPMEVSVFKFASVAALPVEPFVKVSSFADKPLERIDYTWRGPPPDVFAVSPRRRI